MHLKNAIFTKHLRTTASERPGQIKKIREQGRTTTTKRKLKHY